MVSARFPFRGGHPPRLTYACSGDVLLGFSLEIPPFDLSNGSRSVVSDAPVCSIRNASILQFDLPFLRLVVDLAQIVASYDASKDRPRLAR